MFGIAPEIRKWVVLACIVVVLIFAGVILSWCAGRDDAKRVEDQGTLTDARTSAAVDASEIRDAADERIAEINADVRTATNAIQTADTPADRDRAAIVGLCSIDPSSSPECRLLNADSR